MENSFRIQKHRYESIQEWVHDERKERMLADQHQVSESGMGI